MLVENYNLWVRPGKQEVRHIFKQDRKSLCGNLTASSAEKLIALKKFKGKILCSVCNFIAKELKKPEKNRWVNAPKNAKYFAIDADGLGCFYPEKPTIDIPNKVFDIQEEWVELYPVDFMRGEEDLDGDYLGWEKSLEEKPSPKEMAKFKNLLKHNS